MHASETHLYLGWITVKQGDLTHSGYRHQAYPHPRKEFAILANAMERLRSTVSVMISDTGLGGRHNDTLLKL